MYEILDTDQEGISVAKHKQIMCSRNAVYESTNLKYINNVMEIRRARMETPHPMYVTIVNAFLSPSEMCCNLCMHVNLTGFVHDKGFHNN